MTGYSGPSGYEINVARFNPETRQHEHYCRIVLELGTNPSKAAERFEELSEIFSKKRFFLTLTYHENVHHTLINRLTEMDTRGTKDTKDTKDTPE